MMIDQKENLYEPKTLLVETYLRQYTKEYNLLLESFHFDEIDSRELNAFMNKLEKKYAYKIITSI